MESTITRHRLIRGNPMHTLYGALPVPYYQCGLHVVLWSHIGILMHLIAAEPRSTSRTFIPISVSLWNDLADQVCDVVRLAGIKSKANVFFMCIGCSQHICLFLLSHSILSFYEFLLWGWGLRVDKVLIALSRPCIADLF